MTAEEVEKRILENFKESEAYVLDSTGGGDHFEIRLSAPELEELSRVERHQKVMELFKEELDSGEVHALSIKYLKRG